MKRFLRAMLAFLEAKFPDRVIVTPDELVALKALPGRLERVEAEVQKFNLAMGFGGIPKNGAFTGLER